MNDALWTILFPCVFTFLLGLIIYFIMVKWMKSKSYDEMLEEQKKERGDYVTKNLDGDKKEKLDKRKNKSKKFRDKDKGSDREESGSVGKSCSDESLKMKSKPHVEFEPDSELIEEPHQLPVDAKKRSNQKAPKPILLNKADVKEVSSISVALASNIKPPVNSFDKVQPKDDFELKHSRQTSVKEKPIIAETSKALKSSTTAEKSKEKPTISDTSKTLRSSPPADKPKDIIEPKDNSSTIQTQSSTAPIQPKKVKAKKSEMKELGSDGIIVGSAIFCEHLKQSVLNEKEIQGLIEILLNKQQEVNPIATEWIEPGQKTDTVSLLKKQIEELEKTLEDERHLSQTATSKLKEVRNELNQKKIKLNEVEKSIQQIVETKDQETKSLQHKLDQAQHQHNTDVQQLHAKMQQMSSKYTEKLAVLKQETEESTQLQARLSQIENEHDQALSVLKVELETALNRESALRQTESESQLILTNLKNQLEEMQQKLFENSQFAQNQSTEIAALKAEHHSVLQHLQARDANERDLRVLNEKLQSENSEFSKAIVELSENIKQYQSKLLCHENDRGELEKQCQALQTLCTEKQSALDELEAQLKVIQSNANVTPIAASVNDSVQENNEEINNLRQSVESCQNQNEKFLGEIKALKEELENQKNKNNELREKNWKVMEALNTAENKVKQLESNKSTSVCDNNVGERMKVKALLLRLHPLVHVEDLDNYDAWLNMFESQALDLQQKSVVASNGSSIDLQKEVEYYRSVLTSTENILRELENSVESEETKWKREMLSLSRKNEALEKESKTNIEKLLEKESMVGELDKKVKQLELNILSLSAENNKLKVSCDELNQRISDYDSHKSSIDQLQQEVKILTTELSEEKTNHKKLIEENSHLKGAVNGVSGDGEHSTNGKSPLISSDISSQETNSGN